MKPRLIYLNYFLYKGTSDYYQKFEKLDFIFEPLQILAKQYDVTVFDVFATPTEFSHRNVAFKVFKKVTNRKWYVPLQFHKAIIKHKPDVIYCQGLMQMYFMLLLVPFLKKPAKILVHHHAEKPPTFIKILILKQADKIVDQYFFTGKQSASGWVKSGVIKSIEKISPNIEASTFFNSNNSIIKTASSYLWVARLDNNKDPLTVIQAFIEFLKAQPEAKLTMVFSSDKLLPKIKDIIGNNSQITLLGKIPHSQVEKLYQQHEFFILASFYEGGSIALIESLACGCIPIVSNIPSSEYITNNHSVGYSFTPGNIAELLHCLTQSTTINVENERQKALTLFKDNLSFEAIANTIHNTIVELNKK